MTDSELLDWLDSKTGRYTGRVIWRWSTSGRGWRLHETKQAGAVPTVREAIKQAIQAEAAGARLALLGEPE